MIILGLIFYLALDLEVSKNDRKDDVEGKKFFFLLFKFFICVFPYIFVTLF